MQKLVVLVLVLVVLLDAASPVSAQAGEAIPACTPAEIVIIGTLVPDYLTRYIEISQMLETATAENLEVVATELNDLQVEWWAEAVPELPRCALAIDLQLNVGRLLDELLLSIVMLAAGYYDLTSAHSEAMSDLSLQAVELTEALTK